jgi:predicted nucleic acid-binding protein
LEVDRPEVILCDTSFLTHFERARRNPARYEHWDAATLDRIAAAQLAINPHVLAEIRFGYVAGKLGPGRVAAIEHNLASFLLIPLDEPTLDTYVELRVHCRKAGRGIGFHDCWIAATARSRNVPLVSCDRGHVDLPKLETIYLAPDR